MDNPCCTNMNTPKFIGTLDWSSGKFAFSYDSNNTVWYAPYYSDFSNVMLSILCGDPPKVSINQMPPATSLSPPTPKHTKTTQRYHRNQFISLLRVRDSHQDYGRQPFQQSSRKVSSNYKALSFFSLVMDSSRVLLKATVLVLFSFSWVSFNVSLNNIVIMCLQLMFIKLYSLIEVTSSLFLFKGSVTSTFKYMKSLWCTS